MSIVVLISVVSFCSLFFEDMFSLKKSIAMKIVEIIAVKDSQSCVKICAGCLWLELNKLSKSTTAKWSTNWFADMNVCRILDGRGGEVGPHTRFRLYERGEEGGTEMNCRFIWRGEEL